MEEWPAVAGEFAELPAWLHPQISERLKSQATNRLFSHQREALDLWRKGSDVVVTTGTNSGKTLCYSLPALQASMEEPAARSLMLFPTKALAQDQLGRIRDLSPDPTVVAHTYDGDTPKGHRSAIRRSVRILVTNPDMLHVGILPNHEQWAPFFKSLRVIAVDEMHMYRGVFGSHVGNVMRRLMRLCELHGSRPSVIACSATIDNPREAFEKLVGRPAMLVDRNGAPHGKRTYVLWNPPEISDDRRMSPNTVTSELLCDLISAKQKTLAFSRSRVGAELVLQYTRKRLASHGLEGKSLVDSYRAGYTPKERRAIEANLHRGSLRGLSTTNAMELGVDVGMLDAVVMNGFPGSVSSFWQQAGRAGRGVRDGLAIMVAHDDPLEQFLLRQPELLLHARLEGVAIDPYNPSILKSHLSCAAFESPLGVAELSRFGPDGLAVAEALDREGELHFQGGRFFCPQFASPAPDVNIRGSDGTSVSLQVEGVELGVMERWRALTQAHEGAIYLHRGESFLVETLDLETNAARLVAKKVDYYTQSVVQSVLDASPPTRQLRMHSAEASLGRVNVTDLVLEYRIRSLDSDAVLDVRPLDLPPLNYETSAVRLDLPDLTYGERLAAEIGGVHGLEHALLALAPLCAGCDRSDLGSVWYAIFPETHRPAIFVFDRTPGGVGLAERLFSSLGGWLRASLQLLTSCDCLAGCPACLLSARCESGNEPLDKAETLRLLSRLV